MRVVLALAFMVLVLVLPAQAQTEEQAWQAVVSGQIEAFRTGDGEAALGFAGAGFRQRFSDPDEFLAAIVATGYGPIVESRSHSFGEFTQVSETLVMQVVHLVGKDRSLYEALYQMGNEPDVGWRVVGVMLRKEPGMGI
jgi:hypothetical protein